MKRLAQFLVAAASARRTWRGWLLSALLSLLAASGAGAQGSYVAVQTAGSPSPDGTVTIVVGGAEDTYVPGLGWLSGMDADPPVISGDSVFVSEAVLAALRVTGRPAQPLPTQVAEPRLGEIRASGDAELRFVLDLPNLEPDALAALRSSGQVGPNQELRLHLPPLSLPAETSKSLGGVTLSVAAEQGGTLVTVTGTELQYDVFPLTDPTRLVLDLRPDRHLELVPGSETTVAPGVTYSRFTIDTPSGGSVVHLVTVQPSAGELRVVGTSRVGMTTSELSSGGIVALNASYFDTANHATIGYLVVDHSLVSQPSRGRASVGFNPGWAPIIARTSMQVSVYGAGGLLYTGDSKAGDVEFATTAGTSVGNATRGVLVVQDGVVTANRVGPLRVPAGGYALAYRPEAREVALLDVGDYARVEARVEPAALNNVKYAVEGGPLLVQNGQPAYEPLLERFAVGERILDGLTQQAAVGVTASGDTLLLVAETMRAAELVPLFIELGADSAMRLDSGGSATLVINGKPVNTRVQRKVVTAIVLVPAGSTTSAR